MNSSLLLASNIGEKFATGGITTLIGLLMTFAILTILILFIVLVRFLITKLDLIPMDKFKAKIKDKFKRKEKKSDSNVVEVSSQEEEKKDNISDDLKEVIEEAVKSYVKNTADDGKPHENIKIVNIKEVE